MEKQPVNLKREKVYIRKRRRRTFDNKSLKVIGGMGITCRRGWGAK